MNKLFIYGDIFCADESMFIFYNKYAPAWVSVKRNSTHQEMNVIPIHAAKKNYLLDQACSGEGQDIQNPIC